MSITSVPGSLGSSNRVRPAVKKEGCISYIKSTLVSTPMVLEPSGSTSRASFKPSELARSWLAAVTARIIELGLVMNLSSISLICLSMSLGYPRGRSRSAPCHCTGNALQHAPGLQQAPLKVKGRQKSVRPCLEQADEKNGTLTLVIPGKSTRVKVRTLGLKMRKLMGSGEMPVCEREPFEIKADCKRKFRLTSIPTTIPNEDGLA